MNNLLAAPKNQDKRRQRISAIECVVTDARLSTLFLMSAGVRLREIFVVASNVQFINRSIWSLYNQSPATKLSPQVSFSQGCDISSPLVEGAQAWGGDVAAHGGMQLRRPHAGGASHASGSSLRSRPDGVAPTRRTSPKATLRASTLRARAFHLTNGTPRPPGRRHAPIACRHYGASAAPRIARFSRRRFTRALKHCSRWTEKRPFRTGPGNCTVVSSRLLGRKQVAQNEQARRVGRYTLPNRHLQNILAFKHS